MAWLGPIIILVIGLAIIWVFLRRYRARRPEGAAEPKAPSIDPGLQARIEEELKGHRS